MLGEPTRDLFCGFKLWRGTAADAVFAHTTIDGWVFDAEALAVARALGYRITEAGIVWNDRDGSRLSMTRVFGPVLRELVRAAQAGPGRRRPGRAQPTRSCPSRPTAARSPGGGGGGGGRERGGGGGGLRGGGGGGGGRRAIEEEG